MADTIKIDFGRDGGGARAFHTRKALEDHVEREIKAWIDGGWDSVGQVYGSSANPRTIPQSWRNLLESIRSQPTESADHTSLPEIVEGFVAGRAGSPNGSLISANSRKGLSLLSVLEQYGPVAAASATTILFTPNLQNLQFQHGLQMIGMIAYLAGAAQPDAAEARRTSKAINELLDANEDVLAKGLSKVNEFETAGKSVLDDLSAHGEADRTDARNREAALTAERLELDKRRAADWRELYELYTEKLAVEAPVELWDGRAEKHEAAASRGRLWAIGVGIGGLLVAVIVAVLMKEVASWLFAEATVAPAKPTDTGLRPTFHVELIFAASATLLYLTIYLWLMRVLVRLYMTETHLAIDARGRASMARTYLALTKAAAASDEDRAIVLAALFRPIADGIVRDDALPLITPAALLSGMAGGKT